MAKRKGKGRASRRRTNNLYGVTSVRCRRCGAWGRTNLAVVGRVRAIDLCGQCKRDLSGGG